MSSLRQWGEREKERGGGGRTQGRSIILKSWEEKKELAKTGKSLGGRKKSERAVSWWPSAQHDPRRREQ